MEIIKFTFCDDASNKIFKICYSIWYLLLYASILYADAKAVLKPEHQGWYSFYTHAIRLVNETHLLLLPQSLQTYYRFPCILPTLTHTHNANNIRDYRLPRHTFCTNTPFSMHKHTLFRLQQQELNLHRQDFAQHMHVFLVYIVHSAHYACNNFVKCIFHTISNLAICNLHRYLSLCP